MFNPYQDNRNSHALTLTEANGHYDSKPRIIAFGGQDTPSIARLLRWWQVFCAARLPVHALTVAEWPTLPDAPEGRRRDYGSIQHIEVRSAKRAGHWRRKRRLPAAFERKLARLGARFVGYLDRNMALTKDGRARDWRAWLVGCFTQYTLTALYRRGDLGQRLLEQATEAIRSAPVDLVIGHSLGGTLALLAAHQLERAGDRSRRFALITLGTSSGRMIAESPMLKELPRKDGLIALPSNIVSWQHFWSPNDYMVAASSLPKGFDGVEMIEVDTGPFSLRGHAHALPGYLTAPEVMEAMRKALARAQAERSELVNVSSPSRSGANSEK